MLMHKMKVITGYVNYSRVGVVSTVWYSGPKLDTQGLSLFVYFIVSFTVLARILL